MSFSRVTMARLTILLLAVLVPGVTRGAGLVPCGGPGQPDCQFCHVAELVDNVFQWVAGVLTIILVILIIFGGLRYVTSTGNVAAGTAARRIIANAMVGYVVVLLVWTALNFGFRVLIGGEEIGGLGPWNEVQCVPQPEP